MQSIAKKVIRLKISMPYSEHWQESQDTYILQIFPKVLRRLSHVHEVAIGPTLTKNGKTRRRRMSMSVKLTRN